MRFLIEGVAALAPFFLWNVSEGYGKIPFECRTERKSGLLEELGSGLGQYV